MDSRINRRNGILVYNWCKAYFGRNTKLGNYPKIIFHTKKLDKTYNKSLGEFNPWTNTIKIYLGAFEIEKERRFLTFINTIIHEFAHYHQDIKTTYGKYTNYSSNPLEIEANQIGKMLQYECYNAVFRKKIL